MLERLDQRWYVRGPVTLTSVQALYEQGKRAFVESDLSVDVSGISEADSSAVALMLAWVREARARGGIIRFENLGENLKTLISLYDVGEFLPGV